MNNIALTGATGFVGGHLLSYFNVKGITPKVLGRNKPDSVSEENFFKLDFDQKGSCNVPLNGIDVVIHCAARAHVMNEIEPDPLIEFRRVNVEATLKLAKQAVKQGVSRFIFISTVKVNGEKTALSTPFLDSDERLPEDAYGQSKAEAEVKLLELGAETGMDIVIVRPPLIYGPGVKANFKVLLKLSSLPLPLPFLGIDLNKRSLVSVFNLADLIYVCLTHPNAKNKVFLVSDDRDVSTKELFSLVRSAMNKKCLLFFIHSKIFLFLGRLLGKQAIVERMCGSLQVDISNTKLLLNWSPPFSMEDGMLSTVRSFNFK